MEVQELVEEFVMGTLSDHRPGSTGSPVPLSTLVERWLAAGIISPEQADRMTTDGETPVSTPSAPHRAASTLAIEALGYLGGVVVLVSSILIMHLYWQDLSDGTRALVVWGVSIALLGAGLAVPARLGEVGVRLRSVLWVAATVAFAAWVTLLTQDVLDIEEDHSAVIASAGTAVVAGVLWLLHRELLQQLAMVLALMLTMGSSVYDAFPDHESLPGVAVWAVAAAWMLLGWARVLQPRRVVVPVAALGVVIASMMTIPADAGIFLAIGSVTFVVALAVLTADLPLLAVGAFGTLNVLPAAVNEWFPDSDAVPFVLLGVGLILVLLAVWAARRRSVQPHEPRRDWSHLPVNEAVTAAVVVVLVATATVVGIGLG